jgi:hypothetical protein
MLSSTIKNEKMKPRKKNLRPLKQPTPKTVGREEQIARFIVKHGGDAARMALQDGHSITVVRNNNIVRKYPNGKLEIIASIDPDKKPKEVTQKRFLLK